MKNMKRLIAATFALGLATLSAVNVTACNNESSNPEPENNDLTSSFKSSYDAKPDGTTITLESLGLRVGVNNPGDYDFIINNFDITTVNTIIKAKAEGKIKNPIFIPTDAQKQVPTAEDQEIAVITGADQTDLIPSSQDNSVVTFNITLTMWKSKTANNAYVYESTTTQMTVSIHATVPFRMDLANLVDLTVQIDAAPQDKLLDYFNSALIMGLKNQKGYETIGANNIVITKAGTDTPLALSDFSNGATIELNIKIVPSSDPGDFYGGKDNLKVSINYNIDLAGLPAAATPTISAERDIPIFIESLVTYWKQIAVYQTLQSKFINVTKADGNPLVASELVKGASLSIKVSGSATPAGVHGNKTVNVTINS